MLTSYTVKKKWGWGKDSSPLTVHTGFVNHLLAVVYILKETAGSPNQTYIRGGFPLLICVYCKLTHCYLLCCCCVYPIRGMSALGLTANYNFPCRYHRSDLSPSSKVEQKTALDQWLPNTLHSFAAGYFYMHQTGLQGDTHCTHKNTSCIYLYVVYI